MPPQPVRTGGGIGQGTIVAGLVVVALIVGGIAFVNLNGKNSGPAGSNGPGISSGASSGASQVAVTPTPQVTIPPVTGSGITFEPSTLTCDNPVEFTTTAMLPASVQSGDTVTVTFDGKAVGTTVVEAGGTTTQQPDGSWVDASTTTSSEMQTICDAAGMSGDTGVLTTGKHTMTVSDANEKVLASGSYTVIAPTKTSAPTSSGITFEPSTLSCSTPVDFVTTIRLPASVNAGDTVTEKFDGTTLGTGSVQEDETTVQQPDGSWTIVTTSTADGMQTACEAGGIHNGVSVLTAGTHTLQIFDANGTLLAEGSYTVTQ